MSENFQNQNTNQNNHNNKNKNSKIKLLPIITIFLFILSLFLGLKVLLKPTLSEQVKNLYLENQKTYTEIQEIKNSVNGQFNTK